MKVLVVEDSMGMRRIISNMLKGMGYPDVVEARHGGEAWDVLRTTHVELLLTDWNMPIVGGLDLLERVRHAPAYDQLPVLMLTSRAGKEDVVTALKAGVDGYLAKPFTPQQLESKIRAILGRRSQRQLSQILGGKDPLDRSEEHPLILFGEEAGAPELLIKEDKHYIVRFLSQALDSLNLIRRNFPQVKVGYGLEASSNALTKRLRAFGGRIKLLMVSTHLPGGGVTLARLATINSRSDMRVFVLCDSVNELSSKERFGLDRLGVYLIERHKLTAEELGQIFNEFVFAKTREGDFSQVLAPEEIRRRLENDIRHTVKLPVLPQVYHRIAALDRDRESEIQDWVKAIEVDPLSQAQVIRRARSPVYGFRGEITELNKAVILMGKNAIKELIVSGAVKRSFEGVKEQNFSVEDFWLHSVAVAGTARILSLPLNPLQQTPDQKREMAELALSPEAIEALKKLELWERLPLAPDQDPFTGGMMHDIGKVALVHSYPGLFPMLVEYLQSQGWNVPMLSAEETVAGGAHHCYVGQILADSWKLGTDIARAVEHHHAPAAKDTFAQLIALADFIGGGLYPYPRQATYPLVRLLQGDAQPPQPAPEKPAANVSQGTTSTADPLEAIQRFLPPDLLKNTLLSIEELIALSRFLAPAIRQFTENMRKSI